ncbi:hypothetical protein RXV86_19825 [Alisedimentitalea sp. MJ-SS2]|nr:hypothetical protein [Alisedimentitalea sp. MJ-SS2]
MAVEIGMFFLTIARTQSEGELKRIAYGACIELGLSRPIPWLEPEVYVHHYANIGRER